MNNKIIFFQSLIFNLFIANLCRKHCPYITYNSISSTFCSKILLVYLTSTLSQKKFDYKVVHFHFLSWNLLWKVKYKFRNNSKGFKNCSIFNINQNIRHQLNCYLWRRDLRGIYFKQTNSIIIWASDETGKNIYWKYNEQVLWIIWSIFFFFIHCSFW